MAEAQREPSAQASMVASCSATDCTHNEDKECHAGEIDVQMREGRAVCATFSPDKPKARP